MESKSNQRIKEHTSIYICAMGITLISLLFLLTFVFLLFSMDNISTIIND